MVFIEKNCFNHASTTYREINSYGMFRLKIKFKDCPRLFGYKISRPDKYIPFILFFQAFYSLLANPFRNLWV